MSDNLRQPETPSETRPVEVESEESRLRTLNRFWSIVAAVVISFGLFFAINNVFALRLLGTLNWDSAYLYCLFATVLSLSFLFYPATKNASKTKVPWYDAVLFGLTVVTGAYLASQAYNIFTKGWEVFPPTSVGIAAIVLCIMVVEAMRRCGGLGVFLSFLFFAVYPLFAGYMPGLLEGMQRSFWDTAISYALGTGGLLGIATQAFGGIVLSFMFFGAVLLATGGGKAFMAIAAAIMGNRKGGAAKVSIVTSSLFGMLSGSAIANIITTGSITIPAMKRAGYPSHFAAAVEASASNGGSVLPPVMGIVAFLMPAILGISYFEVISAAAIPAVLFYVGLFLQVHFHSEVHDIRGDDSFEVPPWSQVLKDVWPYVFALLVLMYFLYLGLDGRAPVIAAIVLIAITMLRKSTRLDGAGFFNLLLDAAKQLSMIMAILAGVGFVIGSFTLTGLGHSIAHEIGILAGDNVPLLLALAAVASFVLGMGMTGVAVYIFLVIVVVPVLADSDIPPLAIHLYLFYWGLTAMLTPPVCIGSYTAAMVAGADLTKTAVQAVRLSIAWYLLPIAFVVSPAMVLQGSLVEAIHPILSFLVGIAFVSGGFEGYFFKIGRLVVLQRWLFVVGGALACFPIWWTQGPGLALIAVGLVVSLVGKKGAAV